MNPALKSKVNWTAGVMALLAMASDPNLGNLIPVEWLPKVTYVGSLLTIVFRSFFNVPKE
jgi:hypothetical protein